MQITIREPGSAITHFIAMMMAVFAAVPLLVKAGVQSGQENFLAMAIFMGSMILLYGASATYHSVDLTGKSLRVFRKLDHMMIFVLIAGSYTPVCLIVLGGKLGYTLLALVWGIAAVGMIVKACWITCPKWFSSVIYIAMGWVCVLVFGPLLKTLSTPAFLWLLAGGHHVDLRPVSAYCRGRDGTEYGTHSENALSYRCQPYQRTSGRMPRGLQRSYECIGILHSGRERHPLYCR